MLFSNITFVLVTKTNRLEPISITYISLRVFELLRLFFDFHLENLFHLLLHLLHLGFVFPSLFLHLRQRIPKIRHEPKHTHH